MKKTVKIASVLMIALLMVASLFGCAKTAAPEATQAPAETPAVTEAPAQTPAATEAPAMGPVLSKIKESGKLVLGTSADYPPYEFHISNNGKDEIVGFDIEIAKLIAKELGVELQIQDMAFDGLVAALSTGNIDMVIAGMSPTDERKQSVDFSEIYYFAEQSVLVRAEDADKLTTIESLKGKKVGVQKGTLQETIANEQVTGAEVIGLTKIPALVLELTSKKIDAVIMEKPVADQFVATQPALKVSSIPVVDETGGSAIALAKGNEDLIKIVNELLKAKMDDGTISKLFSDAFLLFSDQAA